MNHKEIPVLIIAFNRPKKLQKLLTKLEEIGACNLFFSVDGPRNSRDAESVNQTINLIKSKEKNKDRYIFRNENLGCKTAVKMALDWFFEINEFGIILEDDCMPSEEFFMFCSAMNKKFIHNKKVFCIQGNRFSERSKLNGFIDLSINFYMWGWATWRDRWKPWSINNLDVSKLEVKNLFNNRTFNMYWEQIRMECTQGKFNSWGYPTALYCLSNEFVNVVPPMNLVVNDGFDMDATHTGYKVDLPYNNFNDVKLYHNYSFDSEIILNSLFDDECTYRLNIKKITKIRLLIDKHFPFFSNHMRKWWRYIKNIIKCYL